MENRNKLSQILKSRPSVRLSNINFSSEVMRKISLMALEEQYRKDRTVQFLYGLLGLLIFGTLSTLLLFAWQNGIIQPLLPSWLVQMPWVEIIAKDGFKFVLVAFVIHLILSRSLFTYYLVKKPSL